MSDEAEQTTLPGAAHAESDAGQAAKAAAEAVRVQQDQPRAEPAAAAAEAATSETVVAGTETATEPETSETGTTEPGTTEPGTTESAAAESAAAEAGTEAPAAEAEPEPAPVAETVDVVEVAETVEVVEVAETVQVVEVAETVEVVEVAEVAMPEATAPEVEAPQVVEVSTAEAPATEEPAVEVTAVEVTVVEVSSAEVTTVEVAVAEVAVTVEAEAVAVEASCEWGRVAVDGSVFVVTTEGERQIGSWAAGTPADGLAFFQRKFDGLKAEVELLEKRLNGSNLDVKDADSAIAKLRDALVEPHAIGDLSALRTRLDRLGEVAEKRRAARREARARQLAEAAAHKERIVSEAESLVESTDWKATGERLRALVDEWKGVPRLDRRADDELWSRFSSARSAFAKRRKAHFAHLDAEREEVRQRKEALVDQAEELADSTDWANTAQRFRDLMRQWKAAGRAQRDVEDKLWERFKSAQDTFFTARNADLDQRDAGFRENLARKEELLAEAQKLVAGGTVRDYKAARTALRSIQQRWEDVGPVPRDTKPRIEGALREVERAVADSEQAEWKRTNPEARARAEATVRQLETSIGKFEKELEKAVANGQQRKADEAEAALTARREWLAQAQAALEEFS